ncbi:NVEALA domain-containing protein [Bacteroides sp. BFG-257]|nr:NVEALA domain-containing protein [Bacteroides sp. BFG-257]UVO97956.1 NVEALA domain-containing protein [Bacteroides sp. BFG-257]
MRMIVKIVFAAAFATVAGYGIYANQKSNAMSDFTLANVEALARGGRR